MRHPGELVLVSQSRDRWLVCRILDMFYYRGTITAVLTFGCVEDDDEQDDQSSHYNKFDLQ